MRTSVAILTIALAAACEAGDGGSEGAGEGSEDTTGTTGGVTDACEVIGDQQYLSLEELECGVFGGGPKLCNWTLEFDDAGHFAWFLHDYMEAGSYYCNGLNVVGTGASATFMGTLDPDTGILTWEGEDYQAQASG